MQASNTSGENKDDYKKAICKLLTLLRKELTAAKEKTAAKDKTIRKEAIKESQLKSMRVQRNIIALLRDKQLLALRTKEDDDTSNKDVANADIDANNNSSSSSEGASASGDNAIQLNETDDGDTAATKATTEATRSSLTTPTNTPSANRSVSILVRGKKDILKKRSYQPNNPTNRLSFILVQRFER